MQQTALYAGRMLYCETRHVKQFSSRHTEVMQCLLSLLAQPRQLGFCQDLRSRFASLPVLSAKSGNCLAPMGLLLEANMMSIHAEGCQCAGRPAVHPRHNARALRQPCNPRQKSSTRQLSGTCRQRAFAHSGAHNLVQASSQPVLAPRCVQPLSTCSRVQLTISAPEELAERLCTCSQDARNGWRSHGHAVAAAHCVFGGRGSQ